ncbi:sugar transferase [Blastococcus xanthinilyticus]|uniref:Undecaprenyl-phosphate galactose phosphotransferase WbaP/exopolysaccharide biosynthesis polyprenyl glycosylphosphotransferase n=1 Tax=Blastococcus xanthinilyticus TaxID=1564164 RepID=A0A5S5CTP9_9ACTN|nr:sugar transferase [Blastococcus xanthinilyticus]TYP87181.1 Undecaprenyl-phosphate galactose phosphotransferase WbaP/exopolysaccharide biosynthesis polyprenyl glycosylphosphotransferase [Blastococcus xanthinilyticus]
MTSEAIPSQHAHPAAAIPDRRQRLDRLRGAGTVARRAWRGPYIRRLVLWDAVCATVAAGSGLLVRYSPSGTGVATASLVIAVALPAIWLFAMVLARSYESRYLWEGPEEFRRVFFAAALLLALVGTISWGLKLEVARGFVVVAIPLATVLTLAHRQAHRTWLRRQRVHGRFQQTALLVGHRGGVAALQEQLHRDVSHGYRVIGCCLPTRSRGVEGPGGLPVLGGLDEVVDVVARHEVDTVAVLPCPELDGAALRRLGWDLEKTRADLLLAPSVSEVAGPRVRVRPVCGLSLLQMERPELRGLRLLAKESFDRTCAFLLLLLLLPVLVAVAVAVKADSSGPVLFRQERVGREGRTFPMLKFRSMHPDAEQLVPRLAAVNDGNGVLFKLRRDPRVTRVGRVLRRYSVDELPQLLNVLRGEMSLVGPRPPLPTEVERYGVEMNRRLVVKPGLTGLWQVSGRSDLSWDDSVRLDIHYVDNWSLMLDVMILWRTLGAVVRGRGAY